VSDYTIGEELAANPFRSLAEPNLYESPDTYLGEFWYEGNDDNGGVHINSGVQNYWFYLLAEGGSGVNDNNDTYSVNAIGRESAAEIMYRSLTTYLTEGSGYEDARIYSIQAAVDLFGECSEEVISVTNAWHAVGVGALYDNSVIADFESSSIYSCEVPHTIEFTNTSMNEVSVSWDFGDGEVSSEENPSHTYSDPGDYIVTLLVEGAASCNIEDSLQVEFEITTDGQLYSAACEPSTDIPSSDRGIEKVELNSIQIDSDPSTVGFEDFTCVTNAQLTEGEFYDVHVKTYSEEYIRLWLDLDGDGEFENSETLYSSTSKDSLHHFEVLIPEGIDFEVPRRIRLKSSHAQVIDSCSPSEVGQVEDYRGEILPSSLPPVADFFAEQTTATIGEEISFTDWSSNVPTSWQWIFEGGNPSTSQEQNPTVAFSESGFHTASLVVSNEYGTDTLVLEDYIYVENDAWMCVNEMTNATSGNFYDAGGPEGYFVEDNCTFLIAPDCQQPITLSFESFSIGNWQYLRAFDGPDDTYPMLFAANDNELPDTVTATSGTMFITISGYSSSSEYGWSASWNSNIPEVNPEADFSISDTNSPLNYPVAFTDNTSGQPVEWLWDFGDGVTSNLQSPTHVYSEPGTYTVSLLVDNCYGSDFVTQGITVQEASEYSVSSDSLVASISCQTSLDTSVTIYNYGNGDLTVGLPPSLYGFTDSPELLILATHAQSEPQYANTIYLLNEWYPNLMFEESFALTNEQLTEDLEGVEVLLIPHQEYGYYEDLFADLEVSLQSFLDHGGKILSCGNRDFFVSNLFTGNQVSSTGNFESTYLNLAPDHRVMFQVDSVFHSALYTFQYNPEYDDQIISLAQRTSHQEYSLLATKEFNQGAAVLNGYTYEQITETNSQIFANSLAYLIDGGTPHWLNPDIDSSLVLSPGDSVTIDFQINTEELVAGEYQYSLPIFTNDLENDTTSTDFFIEVEGGAQLTLLSDSLSFSPVMIGDSSQQLLVVYNTGCDTLDLTNNISSQQFYVTPMNIQIPGYSQDTLLVTFLPDNAELFNEELLFSGTGGDGMVELLGEGLPAPEMAFWPTDTLNVAIQCEDTLATNFTIHNPGMAELTLNQMGGQYPTPQVSEILALRTGVNEDFYAYQNTLNSINSQVDNFTLSESTAETSAELTADLQNKDILLIPYLNQEDFFLAHDLTSALLSFVNSGGKILVCGNDNLQYSGLFEGENNFFLPVSGVINLMPEHPIMDGISGSFNMGEHVYHYAWANYFSVTPIAASTLSQAFYTVAEKNIGEGKVVYVGHTMSSVSYFNNKILGNAMEYLTDEYGWLEEISVDTNSTYNVPPGDSLIVDLGINAEGLYAGDYYYETSFSNNVPGQDSIPYVIHLEVLGEPEISVNDSLLSFGGILSGLTVQETLLISNSGCDDLNATAMINSSNFTVEPDTFVVAPGAQELLTISFSPESVQDYEAVLELSSATGDEQVLLEGSGLPAPEVSFLPDTLHATLECGSSMDTTFVVSNSGEADLILNSAQDSLTYTPTPKVLSLVTFADIDNEYAHTLEAINEHFTDYELHESYAVTSEELEADLQNIDILLLPEQESEYDDFAIIFSSISEAMQNFASEGGLVLVCRNTNLQQSGLFVNSFGEYTIYGDVQNVDQTHPIMEGLPSVFPMPTATLHYNWTYDEDFTPVAVNLDNGGDYVAGYRNLGDGMVVYLGFDFHQITEHNSLMIGNTMKYLKSLLPSIEYAEATPTADTLIAGESNLVGITLDATNLSEGIYNSSLTYSTNAPGQEEAQYVVSLEVTGEGLLNVDNTQIDFSNVSYGSVRTDTLIVSNQGCGNLNLESFIGSEGFSVEPANSTLLSGEVDTLLVSFHPMNPGTFEEVLEIETNDGTTTVNLFGIGVAPPELTFNPDTLIIEVPVCTDSLDVSFEVQNSGGNVMKYNMLNERASTLEEVLESVSSQSSQITNSIPFPYDLAGGYNGWTCKNISDKW
jgi:PKD repeat protein